MNIYIARNTQMESIEMNIKLGKMKNDIFSTRTLSSHLQTDWRRITNFTDDGKVTPFRHSVGFRPFRPTMAGPFKHLTSLEVE